MNEYMSDKEIFEMLKSDFEKNGIKHDGHITYGNNDAWDEFEYYTTGTMQKIVSLAYRCGYKRGVKGRPFDYADHVTKEVSVNKELRVGARVKMIYDYSNDKNYKIFYPPIGVCGTVEYIGSDVLVKWDSDVKDGLSWYCQIKDVEVIG